MWGVWAGWWGVCLGCAVPEDPRPDVWLVTVDTLRADRLGFAGDPHATTPHLDRLAREGAVFEDAHTPIPRTTQALASLFTSRHPRDHGVMRLGDRLPDAALPLAERLRDSGYWTAGVSANGVAGRDQGLDRGFRVFTGSGELKERYPIKRRGLHGRTPSMGTAEATTREALRLLGESPPGVPRMLWVHYMDPHFMYDPPAPYNQAVDWSRFTFYRDRARHKPVQASTFYDHHGLSSLFLADLKTLYDAEISYTDFWIGRLLEAVNRDTLVVFTADHGESLGEHGYYFEHGDFVYQASLAVPLVWWWPGRIAAGVRLAQPVSLLDVVPTLFGLLDLQPGDADGFAGVDLSRALESGAEDAGSERSHFGQSGDALLDGNPLRARGSERWTTLRRGRWKLIRIPQAGGARFELYDLASDPAETDNRSAAEPARLRAMARALDTWRESGSRETSAPLSPDVEAELRGLGYVE
jgi:arylsulfatase A-like enzyme